RQCQSFSTKLRENLEESIPRGLVFLHHAGWCSGVISLRRLSERRPPRVAALGQTLHWKFKRSIFSNLRSRLREAQHTPRRISRARFSRRSLRSEECPTQRPNHRCVRTDWTAFAGISIWLVAQAGSIPIDLTLARRLEATAATASPRKVRP